MEYGEGIWGEKAGKQVAQLLNFTRGYTRKKWAHETEIHHFWGSQNDVLKLIVYSSSGISFFAGK
jgi:hypothetical protein